MLDTFAKKCSKKNTNKHFLGAPCGEWFEAALPHFLFDLQVLQGKIEVAAECPGLPDVVPPISDRAKPAGVQRRRGYDFFIWLEKEKLVADCERLRKYKKYEGMKQTSLIRIAASSAWQKFDNKQKDSNAVRANERDGANRGSDGLWVASDALPDIAPAPAAEIVPAPDGAEISDHDEPLSTPKKKKSSLKSKASAELLERIEATWNDEATPEKVKSQLSSALRSCTAADKKMNAALRRTLPGFRGSRSKGGKLGRPIGAVKVTDEQLEAQLNEISDFSGTMHRRASTGNGPPAAASSNNRNIPGAFLGASLEQQPASP